MITITKSMKFTNTEVRQCFEQPDGTIKSFSLSKEPPKVVVRSSTDIFYSLIFDRR